MDMRELYQEWKDFDEDDQVSTVMHLQQPLLILPMSFTLIKYPNYPSLFHRSCEHTSREQTLSLMSKSITA